MSFLFALLVFLVVQYASGAINNCPDLSKHLGKGCSVNYDCTKITCTISNQGDKVLSWTIKINKCEDPVTVDISVDAGDIHWSKTFKTDERVGVPGLSMKVLGLSVGVYVKVSLPDSGSNLHLKVSISFGIGMLSTSTSLVDSALPISTYECGIIGWWTNLDMVFKVLLILGVGLVILAPMIWCCYRCCKQSTSAGAVVAVQPPQGQTAFVIPAAQTNVPMQTFVRA